MAQQNQLTGTGQDVFVFVGVFRCLIDTVKVFSRLEDAEQAYADFCGVDWQQVGGGEAAPHPDFEDCTIQRVVVG